MSYQKNYPNGWQSGEAGGTPITPVALDNIENGIANALPKDGTDPMTADLPMGGHRVTGLGEPVEDDDAVTRKFLNANFALKSRKINGNTLDADITLSASDVGARPSNWMPSASDVGAAPSGYGLGGAGEHIADCNIFKSGFYRFDEAANAPFSYGTLIVSGRYSNNCNQIAICNAGGQKGTIAVRQYNGNPETDVWEYVNPPFIHGVQYRTTERVTIDGVTKPVFALEFTTGKMTHGAAINFHDSDITIVRCEVKCQNHVLPYYGGGDLVGGVWSIWYDITGKTFEARMGSGCSSLDYTVRVWYAD